MIPLNKSIRETLSGQLQNIKPDLRNWDPEDHFKQELGLDSLDLVEFVARIEQHYRIIVPDEDLEKMISLEATAKYVHQHLAKS